MVLHQYPVPVAALEDLCEACRPLRPIPIPKIAEVVSARVYADVAPDEHDLDHAVRDAVAVGRVGDDRASPIFRIRSADLEREPERSRSEPILQRFHTEPTRTNGPTPLPTGVLMPLPTTLAAAAGTSTGAGGAGATAAVVVGCAGTGSLVCEEVAARV